jgi:hypothetical protein
MRFIPILILAACLTLLGCSSSSPQTDTVVTGKVTLDGTVLEMGEVIFEKEDGSKSGSGEIQPNGTYRATSVPLGKVRVAVRTSAYAQYAAPDKKIQGKTITKGGREGKFIAVPKKYESPKTSGLEYNVTSEATIEISLQSK